MTSEPAPVLAPAKLNLTLHVTGQRPDGYHLLDSLVVFADLGDRLWFTAAEDLALDVVGPFAEGVPTDRRNLVWQAAEMAGATAHITLEKNLPHGAGLGGGSSDAAAVLRYFDVAEDVESLGADVPVCMTPKAQRMRGIGEVLSPVAPLPAVFAVLVNPGIALKTPDVFAALATKANPPMPDEVPTFDSAFDLFSWIGQMRNDLEPAALSCVPQINSVLRALSATKDAGLVRMSGSGATCFALYAKRSAADAAASVLAQKHPEWWVRPCTLS